MNWLDIIAWALGTLVVGGGTGGGTWLVASRRAQAAQSKRERQLIVKLDDVQRELERRRASDPPSALGDERQRRSMAARAVGLDTGSYDRANSIGTLRCDGHAALVDALDETRSAIQAAASAASMASAGTMRLEETMRRESEATREVVTKLSEKFESLGEWKGGVAARLIAVERDVGHLRTVRGGAAASPPGS